MKRVERWQRSGLTAKEYAAQIGVNHQMLTWWKWRLSPGGGVRKKPMESGLVKVPAAAVAPSVTMTFLEVAREPLSSEPFEVVLGSGVRVRVPQSFDDCGFERLVDVLERRR